MRLQHLNLQPKGPAQPGCLIFFNPDIRMNSTHPLYHDVVHAHALWAPSEVEEVDPGQGQRQYQGAHIRPPPERIQDGAH